MFLRVIFVIFAVPGIIGIHGESTLEILGNVAKSYGFIIGNNCSFVVPVEDPDIETFKLESMVSSEDVQWDPELEEEVWENRTELASMKHQQLYFLEEAIASLFSNETEQDYVDNLETLKQLAKIKEFAANVMVAQFVVFLKNENRGETIIKEHKDGYQEILNTLDSLRGVGCDDSIDEFSNKTELDLKYCKHFHTFYDLTEIGDCSFVEGFAEAIDKIEECLYKEPLSDCIADYDVDSLLKDFQKDFVFKRQNSFKSLEKCYKRVLDQIRKDAEKLLDLCQI